MFYRHLPQIQAQGNLANLLLCVSTTLQNPCRTVTQSLFQVTTSCCWQLLNRSMLWCVELMGQFDISVLINRKPQQCVKCLVKEAGAEGQLFCYLALVLQLLDSSVSVTSKYRSSAYMFRQHVNNTCLWRKLWHQKPLILVDHYLIWQNWCVGLGEDLLLPHLSYQEPHCHPYIRDKLRNSLFWQQNDVNWGQSWNLFLGGVWLCCCHCPSACTSGGVVKTPGQKSIRRT